MFRPEVIEARRQSWLGEMQLAAPLSGRFFCGVALVMVTALVATLFFGEYTSRERVKGELVSSAGLLKVASPNPGRLTKVLVREGQQVKAGDSLIEVSGELDSVALGGTRGLIGDQLRAQKARLEESIVAQKEAFKLQAANQNSKAITLRAQLTDIDSQIELARREADSAQVLFDKTLPLRDKGYMSIFQVQQQESVVLQARSQLKTLERQRLELQQQFTDAESQGKQLPGNSVEKQDGLRRQLADIDQQLAQNEMQREVVLRAAVDGSVATVPARLGQTVASGELLLTLLPTGSVLEAEILIPSRAAGFVRSGDRVMLRYEAYPYQQHGQQFGKVSEVSSTALSKEEIVSRRGKEEAEPLYRVMVKLDRATVRANGKEQPLKPGMAFEADILKERRRLVDWVFAPVRAFVSSASPGDGAI